MGVRGVTSFMLANLKQPLSEAMGEFDFILCRNVLTYFSPAARDAAIANIILMLCLPANRDINGAAITIDGGTSA